MLSRPRPEVRTVRITRGLHLPQRMTRPLVLLLALFSGCGTDAAAAWSPPPPAEPVWVPLPTGSFDMGTTKSEFCRREPIASKTVSVDSAFEVQAYEVTQTQFESVMGYNPSFSSTCEACPVDSVSWHEAASYARALALQDKLTPCYACTGAKEGVRCERAETCEGPRLPTELEWEYATRAGTHLSTYAGRITSCMSSDEVADQIAWYKANSDGRAHQVGRKKPNPWGLYDALGNVAEWTDSVDDEGFAILRGGSWYHNAERSRAAGRLRAPADRGLSYAGIRLVRPVRAGASDE